VAMNFSRFLKYLAFMMLFVVVGGYRFGTGDHVSQLPTVIHFFNPHLYITDFAHQMIFPWYVKSGLFISLAWFSKLTHIRLEYVFFVVYCAVLYGYIAWMDEFFEILGIRKKTRDLALLLLLPYSHLFVSISHFHLVTLRLVPYFFVLPLCIKAMNFFLSDRYLYASLTASSVFYLHQQLGLILFGALFFPLFLEVLRSRDCLKALFRLSIPFSFFFFIHFSFMQLFGSYSGYPWFDTDWGNQLFQMVKFRVPHHLLLSHSGMLERTSFVLVLAVIFSALTMFLKVQNERMARRLIYMAIGLVLCCIAGFIFTKLVPLPIAFNLYLFRSDVLLRIMGFASFALVLDRMFRNINLLRTIRVIFIVTAIGGLTVCILKDNIRIFVPRNELVSISKCIKRNTPVSAFIMASPSLKGLRLYSERSVFVSWKSHGLFFPPDVAREWFYRMKLLCGMEKNIPCQGTPCRKVCQKNFETLSDERLLNIATRYNVNYLLVSRNRFFPFERVCQNNRFVLYRLR